MSTWPDRKAAAILGRGDDARIEQAIGRVLAPTDLSQRRPKAIFRVVPDGPQFGFSKALIGVAATGPVVERFGPFGTERAAHALAKRAAARFATENPRFIVGVIGLEADARHGPPASTRFRAEGFGEGQTAETPACITCGKSTRFYRGRPQLYCPKTGPRNLCVEAAKAKRDREDPARKAAQAKRARDRYARLAATPDGRAQLREKWRRRSVGGEARDFSAIEDQQALGVVPTCQVCGKPTRYTQGRAVRFCPRKTGEKRSRCNTIYSARAYQKRLQADPELKRKKRLRDDAARKATPEAWARHLERNRKGKARRRAQKSAIKPAELLPTGSVLATASPRGDGYEMLHRLYNAVPSNMPPSLRMEIISETALLVLQGSEMKAAVAEASKSVRRNGSRLRYAKPIDDCFWLADETQDMPEMVR